VALPVPASGDRASAELATPSTAAFVSLRATAVDDFGGSLRRTVIRAFAGPASQYDETVDATKISNVVINGGSPVVLTPSGAREFTATFTATDPAGIAGGDIYLYHGSYSSPNTVLVSGQATACTTVTATTSTCRATFQVDPRLSLGKTALAFDPRSRLGTTAQAGVWQVAVRAHSQDNRSFTDRHAVARFSVLRHTKLTASATPNPVRKGNTIAVKGTLTQANWERTPYSGYPGQVVTLQFRKAGTSTYATVKNVTVDQFGEVTVKVTAPASGYWRYVFAGTSTTAPVTSSGAYVSVT
ncbi:hypothetical protein ONA70_32890, partial [Micromonospora yasonensis]|uniref:hypothetical protein n=1 Tax=Micromonospora yasonensis TaxID=1128667 RepID=UPI00222ED3D8